MRILVCGSLAYDVLYTFPGVFDERFSVLQNHAADHPAISIAFNVYNKSVYFGGCAGNIAYNMALLKQPCMLLGIAGKDFGQYARHLKRQGIQTDTVVIHKDDFTSQASVVTDQKGQQVTFFYEGAASHAYEHRSQVDQWIGDFAHTNGECSLVHIAPNSRDFMLASINACQKYRLQFIFDPGQALPLFSKHELKKNLKSAFGCIVNEYELAMLAKTLAVSAHQINRYVALLVVTKGEKGSEIFWQRKKIIVPAKRPRRVLDPTGCGDAYRAAFLAHIAPQVDRLTHGVLKKAGDQGSSLATRCLETSGTQNHYL